MRSYKMTATNEVILQRGNNNNDDVDIVPVITKRGETLGFLDKTNNWTVAPQSITLSPQSLVEHVEVQWEKEEEEPVVLYVASSSEGNNTTDASSSSSSSSSMSYPDGKAEELEKEKRPQHAHTPGKENIIHLSASSRTLSSTCGFANNNDEIKTETEPSWFFTMSSLDGNEDERDDTVADTTTTTSNKNRSNNIRLHHRLVCIGSGDEFWEALSDIIEKDDDSSESGSDGSQFYDPSDLTAQNWLTAIKNAPSFGFAVAALATAVTHPFLFIAGAAAYTAGHRFGSLSDANNAAAPLWTAIQACWLPSNVTTVAAAEVNNSTANNRINQEALPAVVSITNIEKKKDEENFRKSNKIATKTFTSPEERHENEMFLDTPNSRHPQSDFDIVSADWLNMHYPDLDCQIVLKSQEFVGLSAVHFFQVFLSDNAPYNWQEFQKKRGDQDIVYENWRNIPEEDQGPLSMHPHSTAKHGSPKKSSGKNCYSYQTRKLRFKAKTNSFFGPPYATTTTTQRCFTLSKRIFVLESKTELADIPFSDHFYVLERWVVRAEKRRQDGSYVASMSASCQVFFVPGQPACPFEYQIRTKSENAVRDSVSGWCTMAQEALKLAEQNKLNRERRSEINAEQRHLVEFSVASPRTQTESHQQYHLKGKHAEIHNGTGTKAKQVGDDDEIEVANDHLALVKVSAISPQTESAPQTLVLERKQRSYRRFLSRRWKGPSPAP